MTILLAVPLSLRRRSCFSRTRASGKQAEALVNFCAASVRCVLSPLLVNAREAIRFSNASHGTAVGSGAKSGTSMLPRVKPLSRLKVPRDGRRVSLQKNVQNLQSCGVCALSLLTVVWYHHCCRPLAEHQIRDVSQAMGRGDTDSSFGAPHLAPSPLCSLS